MTEADFQASVRQEITAISRRATLEAEIASARDDFRQLQREDDALTAKRLDVFDRKCATERRLWKLEEELDALRRAGCA